MLQPIWLRLILLVTMACGSAFGQAATGQDSWIKVRDMTSGNELRVFVKDSKQPMIAKFERATDEALVVIRKDQEVSIDRVDIDRIDARPGNAPRFTRESKNTNSAQPVPGSPKERAMSGPAGVSTQTSVNINSKPEFETVYRRPPKTAK
jgi:hypothetical protein